MKLSSPEELQAAIDGNRREGRRSSYGAYDIPLSPSGISPSMVPSRHINGNGSSHQLSSLKLENMSSMKMENTHSGNEKKIGDSS